MTGKGHVFLSLFAAVLLILTILAAPAWAQKPPSAKDLAKQADLDQKANRWEAAYEKYKAAVPQKPNDKNYAAALKVVQVYLADSAAVRAITFCNNKEI